MLAQSCVIEAESLEQTADCEPLLDLAQLRRYTLDDMSLQREILELFRDQIEASVATLRNSCGDQRAWEMAAHTLKGTSRAVGAFRLGRAAEWAEREADSPKARAFLAERLAKTAADTLAAID